MERRKVFSRGDVTYLANLCHDCRDCYEACPFTPPHEYNINIPEVLGTVRLRTYEGFARPRWMSSLLQKQERYGSMTVVIGMALVFLFIAAIGDPSRLFQSQAGSGSFYRIVPYSLIVIPGLALGGYWLVVWSRGLAAYLNGIGWSFRDLLGPGSFARAAWDALTHKYFKGGGSGCNYPGTTGASYRLAFHLLVFYGFLSDLVATILAAVYQDGFGIPPPYPLMSAPVLFGVSGGVAIIVGTLALIYMKSVSDKRPAARAMLDLDNFFLVILFLCALTGMATLWFRDSSVMGTVFTIHLGLVFSLFVTAPYSKFVHLLYRTAALAQNRFEETADARGPTGSS